MPLPMPSLCRLFTGPTNRLPPRLQANVLAFLLNRILAKPLADGELAFLRGKTLGMEIGDLAVRYCLILGDSGFAAAPAGSTEDVTFSGDLHTFLLLAIQREDADTLFFQRRLHLQGETATGLHLKNFLDALGDPPLPPALLRLLEGFADLYARTCAGSGATAQPPQLKPRRPLQ
jgi:predicted lipid carrier protein YhbT